MTYIQMHQVDDAFWGQGMQLETDIRRVGPVSSSRSISAHALIWLVLLSALPSITASLSFQLNGQFADWQMMSRQFWLPAQIFEIATVFFALISGFSLARAWQTLDMPVQILALIWLACMILAAIFAPRSASAMLGVFSWLLHALFAFSVAYLLARWKSACGTDWQSWLATSIPGGSALFAMLITLFVLTVGISNSYDWVSSLPGFPHIRHSGYFLLPAMVLSASMIALAHGRLKLIHIVLLIANFGFAIWSGSRGPLAIFAATLIMAVLLFSTMRNPRALRDIVLSIVVGCAISQMVPTPSHSSFNAISRMVGGTSQSVDKLSSGRVEIWRDTAIHIVERPFGFGGNQFRLEVPAALKTYNHPHNSMLQFTFEWGLIGGGALIVLLLLLARRLWQSVRLSEKQVLPFFLAAAAMAAFSMIDGVFYYNLPIMLFLTLSFVGLSQSEKTRPE